MAQEKETKAKVRRPTPLKRDIQSEKRRLRNRGFKSRVLTAIKAYKQAVSSKSDAAAVQQELSTVYSLMDKGVKTGILKANKANRTKSRLVKAASGAKT